MKQRRSRTAPLNVISSTLLASCYNLENDEPGELVEAAMMTGAGKSSLPLSILREEGMDLPPAAAEELARTERRHDLYKNVLEALAEFPLQVVKGPVLAELYPQGVIRHAGDLDLELPEDDIWQAAVCICRTVPVNAVHVSYFGMPRQLVVNLVWEAEDSLLDPMFSIDLTTVVLAGNQVDVGPRVTRGTFDSIDITLLALAEERFQRPFRATDILDMHVLLILYSERIERWARLASEFSLAPELDELTLLATKVKSHSGLAQLRGLLQNSVRVESERRQAAKISGRRSRALTSVDRHLDSGGSWYGFSLTGLTLDDNQSVAMTDHHFGPLLWSPVGTYLLVTSGDVDEHCHQDAMDYLKQRLLNI